MMALLVNGATLSGALSAAIADGDDDDDDDDDDASLAAIRRILSLDTASHSTEVKHSGHVTAPPSHSASRQLVHTTCEQDSIRGCTSGGSLQNAS